MLLWVIKRNVCGFTSVSETENQNLHKGLADEEMKFYQYFRMPQHQLNYLIQKIEKEEYHRPRSNITCGETSNLSTVSALQVNVILLKNIYWSYKNTMTAARNNIKFITYLIQK